MAQAGLLHELALGVIVGYPGGDSHATGFGALGPFSGLDGTTGAIRLGMRTKTRLHFETISDQSNELVAGYGFHVLLV